MATVERNGVIAVTKYNNIDTVDISIMTLDDGNEVLLMQKEVEFLHNTISEWLEEIKKGG